MHHIITHPILLNYGGILQAYALQRSVEQLGIACTNIHYAPRFVRNRPRIRGIRSALRHWLPFLRRLCVPCSGQIDFHAYPFIHNGLRTFIMKAWKCHSLQDQLQQLPEEDAFIVGSDQVWRGSHANGIESLPHFFLSFASEQQRSRSIAYAASFGSDTWEGSPEETAECARLLKDFKAVSVREHSGVRICREHLGVEAVQMPDPTLLLGAEDYSRLISRWWTRSGRKPFIASYLLDETQQAVSLLNEAASQLGLNVQHLKEHADAPRRMDRMPLSIPQWLRCIRDAECVLTDSFHGCVFSIIFNKPFVCLGNESRGTARFDSLLSTFKLQDRITSTLTAQNIVQILKSPINWEQVNQIREQEQARGLQFIRSSLCSKT